MFHSEEKKGEEVEYLAKSAVDYSRSLILRGTTRLETNDYDLPIQEALVKALNDLRAASHAYSDYSLEIDEAIHEFYLAVALFKKFSIGNCYEMALLALYYVINHKKDIDAEIYRITGFGDHVFLVINRAEGSDQVNPETWGADCYICDPWANNYYPAVDYKENLKNYVRMDEKNTTEAFDPLLHLLDPIDELSSRYINQANLPDHIDEICENFREKTWIIIKAMETLVHKLKQIAARLHDKYGENDNKLNIIVKKIGQVEDILNSQRELLNEKAGDDYHSTTTYLEKKLMLAYKKYHKSLELSDNEKTQLYRHRAPFSFVSGILTFFNIHTQTEKELENAFSQSRETMHKSLEFWQQSSYT